MYQKKYAYNGLRNLVTDNMQGYFTFSRRGSLFYVKESEKMSKKKNNINSQ